MLKDFEPRLYQQTVFGTCAKKNTLVVLPTGLGKTAVSMMLIAHRLKLYPDSKTLILAPTKPLVDQHVNTLKRYLEIDPEKIVLFTGFVKPEKRAELWKDAKVIISTPQCVTGESVIFTKNGPTKIKEFVESFNLKNKNYGTKKGFCADINEEILGYSNKSNKFLRATKAWKLPANQIIKIKTELKNEIKCTPEHPLLTINKNGKIQWIKSENLKKGCYIAMANHIDIQTTEFDLHQLFRKSNLRLVDCKLINVLFNKLREKKIIDKNYYNYKKRSMPLNKFFLDCKIVDLKMPSELIVSNKTGRSNLITLPKNMDPGLAYIIGAMLGDGHIGNRSSKHGSEVVYSEMYYKSIVKLFSDKVFNIFNIKPSSIDLSNKGLIYYSTALAEILNKLGIPKGNKSRKIRVPRYIFTSNTKIIKAFISGVINSDGSGHKNMLRISSVSKLFIDDLRWLLLRLGVVSSIYISNGKTHYIKNRKIKSSKAYHLIISGRANIRKLLSSSFIDENKRKSFESNSSYIKKKGTRSKDILPVKGALRTAYYEHRQKRGKTLNEFRTAYHAGYLSKQYLKKNLVNLKSDIAKELLEIINLPLRWVKIKEIEKIKSKCFVYDLTVENDHNFICNLLVNHNTIENDVINGKIKLEEVSVITFDECHRATGDYSYVWLAKQYEKTSRFPRVLGLTASPGSDLEKINEILDNLFIEEIEVKVEDDPDVKPYVQDVEVKWEKVDFPDELKEIQKYLKSCLRSKLVEIKNFGYLNEAQVMSESKMELLKLQAHLQGELISGNRDFIAMKCVSLAAEAMKVQHAIELVETQGLVPLQAYLEDLEKKSRTTKTKAVQNLVRDINFRSALVKTKILRNSGYEHPKMGVLSRLVEDRVKGDYKLIVFTQYRDSGVKIVDELNKIENIEARLFVGQAKKKDSGLTQKKQIEMLDDFREGKFNVLVSSSVGEEGLDIPQVDEVMFYEPIPSAIRHIQRKGRTGRQEKGVVTILMTKGTRDEGYRWSAHHKEKRMYRILKDVKKNISLKEKKDTDLNKFLNEEDKVKVFADYREKGSGVIKELIELGAKMNLEALESADYVLSNRVGVEFKTQGDFVDSILDGRLLSQVKELRSNFEKPLVVVEGDRDIYSIRNVHPNAIKGVLSAVSVDFGVPILHTKNFKDTAALLHMIAKREQETERKDFSLHGLKKPMSFKELQEYIVSALPGVGGGLAKPLLREFKTVKNIVNASEEELKKVNLIGEKKAKKIKEIVDKEYSNL